MQGVNTVVQLAGVPIWLAHWGVEYYGEWLLLFTIPGYIGISEMGLGSSTTAELSMLMETGKQEEAAVILRNVFWFVLLVGGLPFFALITTVFLLPWHEWLRMAAIPEAVFQWAFVFLILYAYLALFLSIPLGYYRVRKYFHRERLISAAFSGLEFLAVVSMISLSHGAPYVAFAYLAMRVGFLVFVMRDLIARFPEFRVFPFALRWPVVRTLLKPGLSAMTIYLGQSLMTQGLVTIIGVSLGGAKVVLFTTTRTLVSMVKQLISILNLSITGEFSYAFGANNLALLRRLFRLANQINIGMALSALSILYVLGPWVYSRWTGGAVDIERPFLEFMLLGAFISAVWNVRLVLLVATNRLGRTGFMFLFAGGVVLLVNVIWVNQFGIAGTALSLCIFEIVMLASMFEASRLILGPSGDNNRLVR